MDQASNDVATLLVDEFEAWFRSLGADGFLPRAFTGVTKGGKQAVVILTGLPFDHVQRRDFLIWLCRAEQFETYAYGTHVGIIDGPSTASEGIRICASSEWYDVEKGLGIDSDRRQISAFRPTLCGAAGPLQRRRLFRAAALDARYLER
jgi:hypothetical protein